jgi:hypothetical protein
MGFAIAMGRRWVEYGFEEGFAQRARTVLTMVE